MICLKKLLLAKLTNRKPMKFVKRENESLKCNIADSLWSHKFGIIDSLIL